MIPRRDFLKSLAITVPLAAFGWYQVSKASPGRRGADDALTDPVVYLPSGLDGKKIPIRGRRRPIMRPPGALPEAEFKRTCFRCHRCGQTCPNDTIRFVDDPKSPHRFGTPMITPSEQGCVLCMKCTQVCPSGALQEVKDDSLESIEKNVKMGVAVVDRSICWSYNDSACGQCLRACKIDGGVTIVNGEVVRHAALYLGETMEQPVVNAELCVGCGLCEQVCPQMPKAITVHPLEAAV